MNMSWDELKKFGQKLDLIAKDPDQEDEAQKDEQVLEATAKGFEELEQMVGAVRSELGPGSGNTGAAQIDAGIQPRSRFLKVPPSEELKKQLLERVYNPAVAGAYIRFMKSVARAQSTGDPEAEAYRLALGFMADDNVTAEQLHEKILAILQALESERQATYAQNNRIESEKIGGLKAVAKNAAEEHISIAEKIKQAELAAEQKIKQIQADLAKSTEANRLRQQELEKSKATALRDLQAAEQELQLKVSADEAALNELTMRFRAERETLLAHAQIATEQPKSATPKK